MGSVCKEGVKILDAFLSGVTVARSLHSEENEPYLAKPNYSA